MDYFQNPHNLKGSRPHQIWVQTGNIIELKKSYLNFIYERYKELKLGGIAPRIGADVIAFRTEDIFIPLLCQQKISEFQDLEFLLDKLLFCSFNKS